MKSIGETLKEAREAKGVTIQQIAMDLNISKEYLVALEEEQFDIFPAEAYLLGFLRNYSEYLGLEVDKSVSLYKNYKISEEPAPLEELVGQQKPPVKIPVRLILIILVLAGAGAGIWYGFRYFAPRFHEQKSPVEVSQPTDYSLDLTSAEWELHSGDRILIPYQDGEIVMNMVVEELRCRIEISDLAEEDVTLFPGDEKILPGGEGIPVIRMKLIALNQEGARLHIERTDVVVEEPRESEIAELIPTSLEMVEEAESLLVTGLALPEDFTLNAQFNSYCLFRYQVDGEQPVEKYYRDGDRIRLDVQKQVMIWGSSAGSVSLTASGESIKPGKSGEVIVKLIQWVKNDEGKYDLVLFPVQ